MTPHREGCQRPLGVLCDPRCRCTCHYRPTTTAEDLALYRGLRCPSCGGDHFPHRPGHEPR